MTIETITNETPCVGQRIAIYRNSHYGPKFMCFQIVARTTKTLIITAADRFRKADATQISGIGSGYYFMTEAKHDAYVARQAEIEKVVVEGLQEDAQKVVAELLARITAGEVTKHNLRRLINDIDHAGKYL